jgi:hypothetical protein
VFLNVPNVKSRFILSLSVYFFFLHFLHVCSKCKYSISGQIFMKFISRHAEFFEFYLLLKVYFTGNKTIYIQTNCTGGLYIIIWRYQYFLVVIMYIVCLYSILSIIVIAMPLWILNWSIKYSSSSIAIIHLICCSLLI